MSPDQGHTGMTSVENSRFTVAKVLGLNAKQQDVQSEALPHWLEGNLER